MSENDESQQFGPGAQPPSTPPGGPPEPPQPPPSSFVPSTNTSGTGGPVPEEIKGWNWGAFWLSWIWGIAHNVWIALLALVPFLGLIWAIVLGVQGSEWAWQHRQFDNIEQFKQTQAVWAKWGWIVFGVLVAFYILAALLVGLAFIGLAPVHVRVPTGGL